MRSGIVLAWLVALIAVQANAQTTLRDSLETSRIVEAALHARDTLVNRKLRAGVRIRFWTREATEYNPKFSPGPRKQIHIGRLIEVRVDSVILEHDKRGRLALARAKIVRADTSAGRKSRFWRAALGAPIGFGVGALTGLVIGGDSWAAAGFAVIGTPTGVLVGALTGGHDKWRRVQLQPAVAEPTPQ